eukprot:CAMPEP_0170538044 /NCGR_PEP_ID=MMETSP0209-20121228/103080_1 /TAXON_ID=665100 ORGANISM="Litonotus pictus, Strain P1" /NCGR_SAMPLE_ID=MMETSP0209 /ASSEMBLY_ACC=CAM_ASM_000301 /LENGTH=450 /DNA_ID=CAMNT_0010839663 /DNA_START=1 /DNA_END=1353 /DNA_ORIENTATION=-
MNCSVRENYIILNKLGKGAFGTVFKVKHKQSEKIRAMKIIAKESLYMQDDEQRFLKEIEILKQVEHMNIIKIYEYHEDLRYFYIITEFVSGGELYDNICDWEEFDEEKARKIFYQIMSAVTYLHSKGILHRDLKPENILVEYSKTSKTSMVLKGEYNEKCDIWSSGCILYVLLVGYPPFDAESKEELNRKIKSGKVSISSEGWEYVSKVAKDLVLKMLDRDVSHRLSAEQVMKHPWMRSVSKEALDKEFKMNALVNMKNFYRQDKLQQATIAYIAYFLTPQDEINEMKKMFKQIDKNGDGTLSLAEVESGFNIVFGAAADVLDIKVILEEMDTNGDGVITYEEFLRVVVNKNSLLNESNLKICFEAFDENNDGKLSAEEIKKALGAKNNDYVKSLINLIDENGNNEIDFDEFKNLMDVILKRENGEEIPMSKNITMINHFNSTIVQSNKH